MVANICLLDLQNCLPNQQLIMANLKIQYNYLLNLWKIVKNFQGHSEMITYKCLSNILINEPAWKLKKINHKVENDSLSFKHWLLYKKTIKILFAILILCHGRDRIIVGFTSTYVINAYHHLSNEFEYRSWRGVLDITCDKGSQWRAAGLWFSQGSPVSSSNKSYCHDITEILLKVVLNTITLSGFEIVGLTWSRINMIYSTC